MITPYHKSVQYPETPDERSPAFIIVITIAAIKVPNIVPLPPAGKFPPKKTTANTGRRYPPPREVQKVRFIETDIIPTTEAVSPINPKVIIFTFAVFMPSNLALVSLSPT